MDMLTRDKVINSIKYLPDSFTIDELIDRLIFIEKVEQGLKQSEEGKVIPHDEVGKIIEKWSK
jgi:predicted transcriptional regulator